MIIHSKILLEKVMNVENKIINIEIDEDGNLFIPSELRKQIKPNMLLTCISSNSLLIITKDSLNHLCSNIPIKEQINRLRVLKANSTEFVMNENFIVNIPDYILDRINFRKGSIVFSKQNSDSFQIIDSKLFRENEDRVEESYGKQI